MTFQGSQIKEVIESSGNMITRKLISVQPEQSKYKDYVVLESSCHIGASSPYPRVYPPYVPTKADLRRIMFEETGNPDDLHDNSYEHEKYLSTMGA